MTQFAQNILQSLGWTLIHSLWQALLIYGLVYALARLFPVKRASARYALGVAGLSILVLGFLTTFLVLLNGPVSVSPQVMLVPATSTTPELGTAGVQTSVASAVDKVLTPTLRWIDEHVLWITRGWVIGFACCFLRLVSGLWYVRQLGKNAIPMPGEIPIRANTLARSLGIRQTIHVGEARILSPIVIGYLKPLILLPIGLLSKLAPEQVETILLHELSHIRRYDYLVNLFQTAVESVFFFNPFVWTLSSFIREERENCCDDMVIANGIDPIVYARTLAQLEASRLPVEDVALKGLEGVALGITGGRNQLLNRIKRIMEKTARPEWSRLRLPLLLALVGLICASWLSVTQEKSAAGSPLDPTIIHADTIIAPVEPEEPAEIEYPAEAEDLFEAPPFGPEFPVAEMFPFPEIMASPDLFRFDSIPFGGFRLHGDEGWEAFEKEFTEKFREEFKEFYEKNHEQLDKILEEMRAKKMRERERSFELDQEAMHALREQMAHLNPQLDKIARLRFDEDHMEDLARQMEELARTHQEFAFEETQKLRLNEDQLRFQEENTRQHFNQALENEARAREHLLEIQAHGNRMEEFKSEIRERLIKDGYIGESDPFNNLSIHSTTDNLTINGIKIKESDKHKYEEIKRKYSRGTRYYRPE